MISSMIIIHSKENLVSKPIKNFCVENYWLQLLQMAETSCKHHPLNQKPIIQRACDAKILNGGGGVESKAWVPTLGLGFLQLGVYLLRWIAPETSVQLEDGTGTQQENLVRHG